MSDVVFRCSNLACAVGDVTIEPKDGGAGSDEDEIRELVGGPTGQVDCPVCGLPLDATDV